MKKNYKCIDELPLSLSAEEVGSALGISRAKAYELVKSEGFPVLIIGKRLVIPKQAFLQWIEEHIGNNTSLLKEVQ